MAICIGQGVRPVGLKEYAKFAEKSLAVHLWLQRKGSHIEIIETRHMGFLMFPESCESCNI